MQGWTTCSRPCSAEVAARAIAGGASRRTAAHHRDLRVQAKAGRQCQTPPGSRGSGVRGPVCSVPGTTRREASTQASGRTCSLTGRALGSCQGSSDTQACLGPARWHIGCLHSACKATRCRRSPIELCCWQQLQLQTPPLSNIKLVDAASELNRSMSQPGIPDASRLLGHGCAQEIA